MDFSAWIKARLREAKSAGLIRVAKATRAAPALAAAPVPAPFRPAEPRVDASARDAAPAPAKTPERSAPSRSAPAAKTPSGASATTPSGGAGAPPGPGGEGEGFSPVVFNPTPKIGAARDEPDVFDSDDDLPRAKTPTKEPPPAGLNEKEPEDGLPTRPTPSRGDEPPPRANPPAEDPSVGLDPSLDPPWFSRPDREEVDDASLLRPGSASAPPASAPPGSSAPPVAVPAGVPRAVAGVGERARRMAEATALARRDLASDVAMKNAPGKPPASGSLRTQPRPRPGGYDTLLALEAETRGAREKAAENAALRRKNAQLLGVLDAHARRASASERAALDAKRAAERAQAELRAALERARLGRDASRSAYVRSSAPTTAAERVNGRADAPRTLREAAAKFLADEDARAAAEMNDGFRRAEKRSHAGRSAGDAMNARDRDISGSRREGDAKRAQSSAREAPVSFLERMKARAEEAAKRREARLLKANAEREGALPRGQRPGWDDSPDVVVPVGGDAKRRREPRAVPPAPPPPPSTGKKIFLREASAPSAKKKKKPPKPPTTPSLPFTSRRPGGPKRARSPAKTAAGRARSDATGGPGRGGSGGPGLPRTEAQLRAAASEMLSSEDGVASLRASGFAARLDAARDVGSSGDPRAEMAALREVLDEVVAHLRALDQATRGGFPRGTGGRHGGFDDDYPEGSYPEEGGSSPPAKSARGGSGRGGGSGSGSGFVGGGFALESTDRAAALAALARVERRERETRLRWGLFSPSHPAPEGADADAVLERRHRDAFERASADISDIVSEHEAETARRTRGAAEASAVDADLVARVWEARSQFARWRDREALAVGPEDAGEYEGAFDPTEVNEEVAERLLDDALGAVARELADACDEGVGAVLEQEFRASGEGEEGWEGADAENNLLGDDVVGPAIERAYA